MRSNADFEKAMAPATKTTAPVAALSQAQEQSAAGSLPRLIRGRVQRFGDNVDTDSIAPTEICLGSPTPDKLARGAFCHSRPEFYELAQAGATVVVAGTAFGTGSSREQAPKALLAAGIKAVVARSFAFIYARNQANSGLLGIKVRDDRFYELAREGIEVDIDIERRVVVCSGEKFDFRLDPIEERLIAARGLLKMYDLHGNALFKHLQDAVVTGTGPKNGTLDTAETRVNGKLEW
jgi:homoaconitate hydratase